MPEISFKRKYETFAVVPNVLQNPQNLVISGRCFAEDGCKGLKHTCTAIVRSHKNLLVVFSLSLPSWFAQLSYLVMKPTNNYVMWLLVDF